MNEMPKEELEKEKSFLNQIYTHYTLNEDPQTKAMREFAFKTILPYLNENLIGLELGCSDGYMTELIASKVKQLHVVDGSIRFVEEAKKRKIDNVTYACQLFEELEFVEKYDIAFASYILEHVLDPRVVLRRIHKALKADGLLFIVVPNSRALSRQLALHMGLYEDLKQLTENDIKFGHRRVYDRVVLNRDIESTGFVNVSQGGLMLKILADFQLDKLISTGILGNNQLEGLYKLGFEYPDFCGSLFSVCKKI